MRRLAALLFPDPPRRIPAHRAISVALRTAHLAAFGTLLGGHVFGVDHSRLLPFLLATIASGVALMGLELASTCAWLFMGKGIAVLLKLLLLAMVPLFWEYRVPLLLSVVVIGSVGSHMTSRLRHHSLLPGWRALGAVPQDRRASDESRRAAPPSRATSQSHYENKLPARWTSPAGRAK